MNQTIDESELRVLHNESVMNRSITVQDSSKEGMK